MQVVKIVRGAFRWYRYYRREELQLGLGMVSFGKPPWPYVGPPSRGRVIYALLVGSARFILDVGFRFALAARAVYRAGVAVEDASAAATCAPKTSYKDGGSNNGI